VAAQVTSEALSEFQRKYQKPGEMVSAVINAVRDLCTQESWVELDTDAYPEPRVRIDQIFGTYPAVRRLLGCQPTLTEKEYCHF